MMEFDITKYAETAASQSFLKGMDGTFAPNRVVYDRQNYSNEDQPYHYFEGKVIECAVLRPNEFDQKYKLDTSGVKTDSKGYKFAKEYAISLEDNEQEKAILEAQRISRLCTPNKIDVLIEYVSEGGKFAPFLKHFQDFKGKEPINKTLYEIAMKHKENVYSDHNFLRDILEDSRCVIEPHLEWENMATGVKCHGYPDVSIPKEIKVDLKALQSARPDDLNKRYGPIAKFNYLPQLAAYNEADHAIGSECYIYAMEKHPLGNKTMLRVSDVDLYEGERKFNRWCAAFKFANEKNLWHLGYEFSILYDFDEDEQEYIQKTKVPIVETSIYY